MPSTSRTRIRTPDQQLRVFVSSTLGELAEERQAVSRAAAALRMTPVMFELSRALPRLLYLKEPAVDREPRLAWTNTLSLSPKQRRGGLASVSAPARAGGALSNKKTASEVEPS
jgi:hypothetical protein